jgi:hypothetical protein
MLQYDNMSHKAILVSICFEENEVQELAGSESHNTFGTNWNARSVQTQYTPLQLLQL